MELTPEKLFGIIGQQTVELMIVKEQNSILTGTVESLKKEVKALTPDEPKKKKDKG